MKVQSARPAAIANFSYGLQAGELRTREYQQQFILNREMRTSALKLFFNVCCRRRNPRKVYIYPKAAGLEWKEFNAKCHKRDKHLKLEF